MLSTILGWLGVNKFALIAAGALALACGYLWLRNDALASQRDLARVVADANSKVIEELRADNERARKIAADQAAALARLDIKAQPIIKEIYLAPKSTACLDSPAYAPLRDGLRWRDAGMDAGRAPAAR